MKTSSYRNSAGVFVMGAIAASAFAGEQLAREVVFSTQKPWATGDLGYVRNTPDTVQYIGCQVAGTAGVCMARNSAGVIHTCSTTDPGMMDAMRALNGDSFLVFAWNTDGTCKVVQVQNDSRLAPK
ncbi:MAG TPA: hypothetical protein VGO61_20985 [Steroidobacteraceae bacterium]|jgi:hypothetical protein|nr:hypothetical protein [Steroidobacteraceae bacterium]